MRKIKKIVPHTFVGNQQICVKCGFDAASWRRMALDRAKAAGLFSIAQGIKEGFVKPAPGCAE